ncbi:hypothetical protein HHS34_003515 [Acidithiobacillus montserratensis]|uniref:Uncharacterized protein n=1 Tax=Acidithiobacillus montserratensis TaxID=2729135 RepID=A0ACD5HI18_9PROT|nr:hypothetical protein [Acidithiobacillus montserratensis]MBN2679809.1 hypothetical protein [Acidithiobacillaceae bacterium]MBU2748124.1 hypothetical protein [Acidithiobacillus montserratensis]
MYKRRAHILFWHPHQPEKAQFAAQLANQLGGQWLEARAECGDISWPDLLIALDCAGIPDRERATHTQCKFWPDSSDRDALRTRILGVIGGFQLLARLDHSAPPPARSEAEAE